MRVWPWFVGGVLLLLVGLAVWPLVSVGVLGGAALIVVGVVKLVRRRRDGERIEIASSG